MYIDFSRGFDGSPDFDWRAYAEWLKLEYDQKVGQAWVLEQENLRLRALLPADPASSEGADAKSLIQTQLEKERDFLNADAFETGMTHDGRLKHEGIVFALEWVLAFPMRARDAEIAALRAALEKADAPLEYAINRLESNRRYLGIVDLDMLRVSKDALAAIRNAKKSAK